MVPVGHSSGFHVSSQKRIACQLAYIAEEVGMKLSVEEVGSAANDPFSGPVLVPFLHR